MYQRLIQVHTISYRRTRIGITGLGVRSTGPGRRQRQNEETSNNFIAAIEKIAAYPPLHGIYLREICTE